MQRVDTATAAATLPADKEPGATPGYFTEGSGGGGEPATVPGQDWFNSVQEELISILTAAGITPLKAIKNQVLQALRNLFFSTGDYKITGKVAADLGWIMVNDGTIGNASSGGTTRANTDCEDLFVFLWTNYNNTRCPLQNSSGVATARGASAAADWGANRRISTPKLAGRALIVAGAGAGLTARTLGDTLGEEAHALTAAENGPHYHIDGYANNGSAGSYGNTNVSPNTSDMGMSGNHNSHPNTSTSGAGDPHNNMQPSSVINVMMKL